MTLPQAKAQYERIREWKLREMAADCEKMAEEGTFLPIGERCGFCLHAIKGGCRLRVIAQAAA